MNLKLKTIDVVNIIEAMNDMIDNSSIYQIDNHNFCITYSRRLGCFVWCREDGKVIADFSDKFGAKRVIMSPKLMGGYRLVKSS